MKWKHVFIDLDGTTIESNPHALPTKRTIEVIDKVQQIMRVSVATGRTLAKAQPIIELLNLSSLCIVASGIQLYDPIKKLIIHEHTVDKERLNDVLSILTKFTHIIHAFNGETDVVLKGNDLPKDALSLFILGLTRAEFNHIARKISHFSDIAIHRMPSWKSKELEDMEICHVQGTKLHRIREICKTYNISEYDCIAAGDGLNDYDMLMAAGLKIVMENGHSDLKKIADIIAPPVQEDGLAIVLEKLLMH